MKKATTAAKNGKRPPLTPQEKAERQRIRTAQAEKRMDAARAKAEDEQAKLRQAWAAAEARPPALEAPDPQLQRALDTAKRQLEAFQALSDSTTVVMAPRGPKTLLEAARELRKELQPLIERAWGGNTFWSREQLSALLAGVEAIEGQARLALVELMAET